MLTNLRDAFIGQSMSPCIQCSASEVTTVWRYINSIVIIII